MLNTEIITYKNYGRCLSFTNEYLEMLITADIGPRIIRFSERGGENLFFEDVSRKVCDSSEKIKSYYGKDAVWYLYGGHRLWSSPEILPGTCYPDNNPVFFEINGNNVALRQNPQRENGIMLELELTFSTVKPEVSVLHRITNVSEKSKQYAAWGISAMDKGGIAAIPLSHKNTGLLPNRMISLWPYTDAEDPRLLLRRDFLAVRQDETASRNLKIGVNNTEGVIAYFNHGCLMTKRYKTEHDTAPYPDFGVSAEIYTCADFLEIETLSPLREIAPSSSAELAEIWSVHPCEKPDEKALPQLLSGLGLLH